MFKKFPHPLKVSLSAATYFCLEVKGNPGSRGETWLQRVTICLYYRHLAGNQGKNVLHILWNRQNQFGYAGFAGLWPE